MEEITDYELIYMIRQNDENAYRLLYERYLPLIWRKIYDFQKQYYEYLPDISDTFHDSLMLFNTVIYSYRLDKEALFGTYLFNCLDYSLKNYRRYTESHEKHMIHGDILEDFDFNQVSDTSLKYDPVSLCNVNQIMELIDDILKDYSERDKEIIYKMISGMKGTDIAKEYNISRKKYSYIVKKFREKALKILEKKEYN